MIAPKGDAVDTVNSRIVAATGDGRDLGAIDQLGAGKVGIDGDPVDFRRQGLILGIEHGPLGSGQLARSRLNGEGLHPRQDVIDLGHGAIGDLKHGNRLSGVDGGLFEAGDLGREAGANRQRCRIVLSGDDPATRRQLGEGVGSCRVRHGQVALGDVGSKVGNDIKRHRVLLHG